MSTQSSKRLRTDIDSFTPGTLATLAVVDEAITQHLTSTNNSNEAKEEKKDERNWFCTNTTFAKQTCIQRTPADVKNWTTPLRSGLEGGMTAAECQRTCGQPSSLSSSLSSSSLLRPARYHIPGSKSALDSGAQGVEVPGVNSTILNSLIASMLPPKELGRILLTSRASYVGLKAIHQDQIRLKSLLDGLLAKKHRSYLDNEDLQTILEFLQSQSRFENKFISYPLLVEYLPRIYHYNYPDTSAFFALLDKLPRLEKLTVLAKLSNLSKEEMRRLIAQGIFQFDSHEIENDSSRNRELWELRDGIFLDKFKISRFGPEILDWFIELRRQEELRARDNWPMRIGNLPNLLKVLSYFRDDPTIMKLVRTFLNRNYYLPIPQEDVGSRQDALADPLVLAIDTGDQKLIDKVAEHYKTQKGISRIRSILEQLVQTLILKYYSDRNYSREAIQSALESAQFRYATLETIYNKRYLSSPLKLVG